MTNLSPGGIDHWGSIVQIDPLWLPHDDNEALWKAIREIEDEAAARGERLIQVAGAYPQKQIIVPLKEYGFDCHLVQAPDTYYCEFRIQ